MKNSYKRFIFLGMLISILLVPFIFAGGGLNINVPDIEPIPEITPEQILATSIELIQKDLTEINTIIGKIETALQQAITAQATAAQITQINTTKTSAQTAKQTAETALATAKATTDVTISTTAQTSARTALATAKAQLVIANNVASAAKATQAATQSAAQAIVEEQEQLLQDCATGMICQKVSHNGGSIKLYSGSNCYGITNNNALNDYFIPLNSVAEFDAFITNKPSGVTVTSCQSTEGNDDNGGSPSGGSSTTPYTSAGPSYLPASTALPSFQDSSNTAEGDYPGEYEFASSTTGTTSSSSAYYYTEQQDISQSTSSSANNQYTQQNTQSADYGYSEGELSSAGSEGIMEYPGEFELAD